MSVVRLPISGSSTNPAAIDPAMAPVTFSAENVPTRRTTVAVSLAPALHKCSPIGNAAPISSIGGKMVTRLVTIRGTRYPGTNVRYLPANATTGGACSRARNDIRTAMAMRNSETARIVSQARRRFMNAALPSAMPARTVASIIANV